MRADSGLLRQRLSPGVDKSTDIGSDALVPASYPACQLSDKLFAGRGTEFAVRLPHQARRQGLGRLADRRYLQGLHGQPESKSRLQARTGPDRGRWPAGPVCPDPPQPRQLRFPAAAAGTAGRLAPATRLTTGAWARRQGLLWQPLPGTSIGIGYRSAVGVDVEGQFRRSPRPSSSGAGLDRGRSRHHAARGGDLQLPADGRPELGRPRHRRMENWSRLGDVAAVGAGCGPSGVCEVLDLDHRYGRLLFSRRRVRLQPGAPVARRRRLRDFTHRRPSPRDILLPDSNRVFLSAGRLVQYSEQIIVDLGLYTHLLRGRRPSASAAGGGSTHCGSGTPPRVLLLSGQRGCPRPTSSPSGSDTNSDGALSDPLGLTPYKLRTPVVLRCQTPEGS